MINQIHKKRIFYYIVIIYWILASIKLINIMTSDGTIFPDWIDNIIQAGYSIGIIFGYSGGGLWAFIGQIITLLILLFIAMIPTKMISEIKNSKIK